MTDNEPITVDGILGQRAIERLDEMMRQIDALFAPQPDTRSPMRKRRDNIAGLLNDGREKLALKLAPWLHSSEDCC